ncbi:MAG: protease inhibitor I42 family protein [Candidatus Limnocylindria bacterium]
MALLSLSLALLVARLVLTPLYGLPLNFLVVFIPTAVAGLVAVYAVALRRERALSVIAALVIGLLAAIWLLAESSGGGGQPTMLNESDNGQTVTVVSGGQITIDLPGNPTTGYSWAATIGDPSVLSESSPPVFTPSSSALGAGGTYMFQYRARAAGRSVLTLAYQRSWETGVPPQKTYQITVVVR